MTRNRFQFAVLVALAAMVLRGVLPAGWMPQAPADNGAFLTICSPHGVVQLADDPAGKPAAPVKSSQHAELCPFAAGMHSFHLAGLTTLAPPLAIEAGAGLVLLGEAPRLSHRQAAFFARGPPLIA